MGGSECAAVGTFCMESLKTPGLYYCAKPGSTPPSNPPTTPDAGTPTNPPTPPASDSTPPQIAISSPAAMATVPESFTVKTTASDNVGVTRVELLVDGSLLAMRSAAPYDFPLVLKAGSHPIKAIAYDAANNKGEASVTVTVQGGGSTPPTPTTPTTPETPTTPPPSGGAYGAVCLGPSQCQSSLCARDESTQKSFCTQACVPATVPCPTGSQCFAATGSSYVCAPVAGSTANPSNRPGVSGEGMGCAVGHTGEAGLSLTLLLIGMLLLARRRR